MGAIIKKGREKLIIKGCNNKINLKNNVLDIEESEKTLHYMLPLLSLANTNLILKGKENYLDSCEPFFYIFEKQGSVYIKDTFAIRIEQPLKNGFIYIDGKGNNALIIGLLLALPMLANPSKIIIRAPIDFSLDLDFACALLKKFGIHIDKANETTFEIQPNQLYHCKKIKTESDYTMLAAISLIGSLKNDITYSGIEKKSLQNDFRIYQFLRLNSFNLSNKMIRKKEYYLKEYDASQFENLTPIIMVLAIFSKENVKIKNIDLASSKVRNQLNTMRKNLTKLKVEFEIIEDEITIFPKKITNKVQLESGNDPYIIVALTVLAIVAEAPMIIKNVESIANIYEKFFEKLKLNNVKIEMIHD